MTLTTVTMERAHHAAMDGDASPPERPVRRTFSAEYKQQILAEYDAAPTDGSRGAILRREGPVQLPWEWRRARDAGALAGLGPRPRPRASSPEQLELARLVIDIQERASELLGRLLAKSDENQRQPR